MSKILCPNIECVNYSEKGCRAKTVHLSEIHTHTVHNGYQQFWKCKEYNVTEQWKKIENSILEITKEHLNKKKTN